MLKLLPQRACLPFLLLALGCWAAYSQEYQQLLCKAYAKEETFLRSFISSHRSYPVKNVSWESWKPRRVVQVTEEGFISWWKRVGEELALDTGHAQNCRMSTGCPWKLSKDDQTRVSKTSSMVGKPELGQTQRRAPPYTCWLAGLLPLTLGRSGFVSMALFVKELRGRDT